MFVASSPTWRHVLVTVAAAGAFSLLLLAASSDVQMVPSADAQASVSGRRQSPSPLLYQYSGRGPRRPAPTHRGDTVAGQEVRAAFRSLR